MNKVHLGLHQLRKSNPSVEIFDGCRHQICVRVLLEGEMLEFRVQIDIIIIIIIIFAAAVIIIVVITIITITIIIIILLLLLLLLLQPDLRLGLTCLMDFLNLY
jgi:hypothetical protein